MDDSTFPDKIMKKTDEVLERADQEDLVHGLLSLLPAGGLVDSVLFRRAHRRARERLEEFQRLFHKQLGDLQKEKLDESFLESEEFDVLVMRIVSKTIWEHSKEKREYLRNILLNSVTVDYSNNPLKETIIEIVSDLSAVHIKVLSAYAEGKLKRESGYDSPSKAAEVVNGLSERDAEAVSHDLYRKGLLDRDEEFKSPYISSLGISLLAFLGSPETTDT